MKKKLAALFLASSSLFASSSSHANDNTISIDNPDAMYGPTEGRIVNCPNLKVVNNIPELTCTFAQEVDGQAICKDDDPAFKRPKKNGDTPSLEEINTRILLTIIDHQAVKHGQCIKEYIELRLQDLKKRYATAKKENNAQAMENIQDEFKDLKQEGKDLIKQHGDKNMCSVIDAYKTCSTQMGFDVQ